MTGCKKNIFQAIQNIIRLVEAGIYLEDFKKTVGIEDKSLKLFIEMWKKIEAEDRSINSFRERVKRLHDVSEFDREISNIFKFIAGKKIVFNGFQYFTPIQHIIYDCFENAGYDIYHSTASGVNAWISDLGDRLEVNLENGETVSIWIDEEPQFPEYQLEDALRVISDAIYAIDDNILSNLQKVTGIDVARAKLYGAYAEIAKILKAQHPDSILYDMYNLKDA